MTGSVALDVVIGLVFIYLLYSLFATVIMEIITTLFGLRARNLRYALRRMLMDETEVKWLKEKKEDSYGIMLLKKVLNLALKIVTKFANTILKIFGLSGNLSNSELFHTFYNQPSIKYLSAGGFANKPSYIAPHNFSKTIIDAIQSQSRSDNTSDDPDQPKPSLEESFEESLEDQTVLEKIKFGIANLPVGPDTKKQLESLLADANNDLQKFTLLLEEWFNDTMERAAGWFKRRVQFFLFMIGFFIAVSFNADTIKIVKKLSKDPTAREQMVALAIEYSKENKTKAKEENDSVKKSEYREKAYDSLQNVLDSIKVDIYEAQNIIRTNWNIPSHLKIIKDEKVLHKDSVCFEYPLKIITGKNFLGIKRYKTAIVNLEAHKSINLKALKNSIRAVSKEEFENKRARVNSLCYKWSYVFARDGLLNFKRLWGYILTALAISLGSPFWFDLLNKLIRVRNSIKPREQDARTSNTDNNNNNRVSLKNRVG